MAGSFPAEWWMRDFAGKVFAIIGRYSEPPTWKETKLLIGDTWTMLEEHWSCRFEVEEEPRGYDSRITSVEKFIIENIGTFYFETTQTWFYLTWSAWRADDKKYNLTKCLIPTGSLVVYPRGGLHHAAHVEPRYDVVSIFAR